MLLNNLLKFLVIFLLFIECNAQNNKLLPLYINEKDAEYVESVYGKLYNTHYSHTHNEWTIETTGINTFDVSITDSKNVETYYEELKSATVNYDVNNDIFSVILTIFKTNEDELTEIIDITLFDVVNIQILEP